MDIRAQIADRIKQSRKQLGITIKELAQRTEEFSAARISNWEQGTRMPGPAETKVLAQTLGVAASYLLCLSDNSDGDLGNLADRFPRHVPLLPMNDANIEKEKLANLIQEIAFFNKSIAQIVLDDRTRKIAGANTFAVTVADNSMQPIFSPGDVVFIDPDRQPTPGQYVLAHVKATNQNVLRKYREIDGANGEAAFELVPLSGDWRTIADGNSKTITIVGAPIEMRRVL